MTVTADKVKDLREKTGAGMMDCKKALSESGGDMEKAIDLLRQKGLATAAKKASRAASEGLIGSYIHAGGKLGVLVEVNCETDFVARNDEFIKLANEIVLHIAAMGPADTEELLAQPYVRETEKKIQDLIAETVGKLGENIQVGRFTRFVLGGE